MPPNREATHQAGSLTVEPSKKRKRKRTPSDRRRKAARLAIQIEATTADRQTAHADGRRCEAEQLDRQLNGPQGDYEVAHGGLYAHKRQMRREIYGDAPTELEGEPVQRVTSRRMAS